MKKIYILAIAIGAFSFSTSQAQEDQRDDLESYSQGPISAQADEWKTWEGIDGTAEDAVVSSEQAYSGSQSLKIVEGNDQLYLIDSQPNDELYTVSFQFYVPSGKEGYFNLQGITPPGSQSPGSFITGNIYFNKDNAAPGIGQLIASDGATVVSSWSFDHDTWVSVQLIVDLENKVFEMNVAGDEAVPAETPWSQIAAPYLGAIDFFGGSEFSTYYVDDVITGFGRLGIEDLKANAFSVYPNPVKDMLNIQSKASVDSVIVYDILGKVVLQENPGTISPAINMSSLATGSYLVKVTIGSTSKTVKILK